MDIRELEGLDQHLDELAQDPTLPLKAKLFDDVELQLTEANIPELVPRLLPKITTVLKQYTQDPTILASMATKLLGPVSFVNILSLAPEASIMQALNSPAPSANLLAMAILHKAAASPSDVSIVSVMTPTFVAFLTRWLAAPQVEVGEKGGKVLGDLLDVDSELPPPPPPPAGSGATSQLVLRRVSGHGKLWRRLFHDRDVYGHLMSLVTAVADGEPHPQGMTPHQLTLAQGRLLRLLPRLALLNFGVVHGVGLLRFAALRMVDTSDPLMHLSLVDFFEAFVSVMRLAEYSPQKTEAVRTLVRDATAADPVLRDALLTLPERTVPEEADALRRWLQEVMPGAPIRVGGWETAAASSS